MCPFRPAKTCEQLSRFISTYEPLTLDPPDFLLPNPAKRSSVLSFYPHQSMRQRCCPPSSMNLRRRCHLLCGSAFLVPFWRLPHEPPAFLVHLCYCLLYQHAACPIMVSSLCPQRSLFRCTIFPLLERIGAKEVIFVEQLPLSLLVGMSTHILPYGCGLGLRTSHGGRSLAAHGQ